MMVEDGNDAHLPSGGAFGGILGAIAFSYLTVKTGDIGGRLVGAFLLGLVVWF
jgi:hypothetical protein